MRSRSVVVIVGLLFLGVIGCAREDQHRPSVDVAFDKMWEVLDEIEAPQERVPMLEDFIIDYPDTTQSVNALNDVVYYRTEKMDDLAGALSSTKTTLAQTTDPRLRFEIGLLLHDLSYEAGIETDLGSVASEFSQHGALGFVDHLDVIESSEKSGSWEVMLEHATAMEKFANEAAFRAAYPDDDFTDERVAFSVNRRRAWVLAYQGGALTNLRRLEEAEAVFGEAETLPATTDYLGIPETPIDIYHGQAALLLGQPEQAAEFFAHDAVMGRNPSALEGLKEAYATINGDGDGFDDYVSATRDRIARPIGDVTLADYSGNPLNLSALTGRVMVISFWNPG